MLDFSSFQFPRTLSTVDTRVDTCQRQRSAQRRQTFFVKARGSRRNFSNITFSSLLLCYCILHSVPNKTGSLRDRRKSHTSSRGRYSHFLCLHGETRRPPFSRCSSSSSLIRCKSKFYFFKNLLCAFNSLQPMKNSWPGRRNRSCAILGLQPRDKVALLRGQYNKISRRIFMKMEFSSRKRKVLLFFTTGTNMVAVNVGLG